MILLGTRLCSTLLVYFHFHDDLRLDYIVELHILRFPPSLVDTRSLESILIGPIWTTSYI